MELAPAAAGLLVAAPSVTCCAIWGCFLGSKAAPPKRDGGRGSRASGDFSQEFSASPLRPFAQNSLCRVIRAASETLVPVASGCSAEQEMLSWGSHLTSSVNGLCVIIAAVGFSCEALCLRSGLLE